jgi:hypothetical protein
VCPSYREDKAPKFRLGKLVVAVRICGDAEVGLEVGYGNLRCSCSISGGRRDPAPLLMGSLGRLRSLLLPLRQNAAKSMLPSFLERPASLPLLNRNMLSFRSLGDFRV